MNAHQHAAADHAAGMKFSEVFLVKATRLQEHHRQRVAQSQHHCRARRRCEVQRTSFLFDIHIETDVRVLRQR